MNFSKKYFFNESTVKELYDTTVKAFPKTLKRQHLVDLIDITELRWTPYVGMKTLYIKGVAHSEESLKDYDTIFVIKNINYNTNNLSKDKIVEIKSSDGRIVLFEKFNEEKDVLVRCNCQDFFWRWNYTDHLDKSLQGRVRRKYEAIHNPGSSNPLELPGLCKHLIKSFQIIQSTIS